MTRQSIRELVRTLHPRYIRALRREKTCILDEFVALSGYHRKHAIRLLQAGYRPKARDRRGRPRTYTNEVKSALLQLWEVSGHLCSRRLQPFLPQLVEALERHGELHLPPQTKHQLFQAREATIDRLLRTPSLRRPKSWAKPASRLRQVIPVHTLWEQPGEPGFVEVDLVAHGGESAAGEYLHTLTVVDIATSWCEPSALPNRGQQAVFHALEQVRRRLPFPLRGIDSDNDSAFLNGHLWKYCCTEKLRFTRARPYRKNDQAHVEQKNWIAVRRLIGYDRYEPGEALALLEGVYADWRLLLNFFHPVMKLVSKERVGSLLRKRYDEARTPYERVLATLEVAQEGKEHLRQLYLKLNPVDLRRRVEQQLRQLWELAR